MRCTLLLCLAVALAFPGAALARVPIDDFEAVSDWSGLTLETTTVRQGTGAGRWANHVQTTSARKTFATPLDASGAKNLDFWAWSAVANGAGIEVVLDSDDPASTGQDYYSFHLVVSWTGWRRVRLPLASFSVARAPLGWNQIKSVSFNASGWSNTPLPDTVLVFDDMNFDGGPVISATATYGWSAGSWAYQYAVELENGTGSARTLALSLDCGASCPFTVSVNPASVNLAAATGATVAATITIPGSYAAAHPLESKPTMLVVKEAGQDVDEQSLATVVPFPQRAHPRTLVDAADFVRVSQWILADPWAAQVRDGVVARASGFPASFTSKYGVASWQLPPEGGQWTPWYVCPTHGVKLKYTPPMAHTCPVDNQVLTGWPYDQVVYSWMHSDLAEAARASALTWKLNGDAAKAQVAAGILKAYADHYGTYPLHDVNGKATSSGAHVLAQTLDESGWIIDMAWAYDLIADSAALTAPDRAHIEKDLLRAAATTIERNPAGTSNWQSWHNAALSAVGFAVDDPPLLSAAVDSPTDGFEMQMAKSVPGDGIWFEGSWGYHFYALDALGRTAEMFRRAGRDLFADKPLEAMYRSPLGFAQPDLSLPSFNDDGGNSLGGNSGDFERAFGRYADPVLASPIKRASRGEDALWFGAESLPASPALPSASVLFPDSGFAVLRAGAGLSQDYLAFKFGPHGGWHGHYDKLGFVLFGRGVVMALDPGTQSYAAPTHATWDKVTIAHNTVVVDGTTQAEATGALHRFVALPDVSMAAADGGKAYATARLLRTMVLAGDYVVDRFRVTATDGKAHQIDWAYHDYGTLTPSLPMSAYALLPTDNGYQNIKSVQAAAPTAADWSALFQVSDSTPRPYGSVWANDAAVTYSFTQTTEQAWGGSWSGKMTYGFAATGNYVLFTTQAPPVVNEAPVTLRLQVYGDGSNNTLTLRVMDAASERFVKQVGPINWTGWRSIELADISSWSHYLGNADGVFDAPAQSVVIEVDHVATGATSGTLFVDDVHLVFANTGEVTVEDFELPTRALSLRMLGAAGTTVVRGDGLGPDLLKPVPMLLARRQSQDAIFVASLEPFGDAAAVSALQSLATDAVDADEAVAVAASGLRFSDALLAVADGAAGKRRTFGEDACDGTLCLVRRGPTGSLLRLALAQGGSLTGKEGALLTAASAQEGIQVDFGAGSALAIATVKPLTDELRILAPSTAAVTLNGVSAPFAQDGQYVVLNGAGGGADAGATSLADGAVAAADGSTLESVDAQPAFADAGGTAPTKSGCGCQAGTGLAPALALLLFSALRRRR